MQNNTKDNTEIAGLFFNSASSRTVNGVYSVEDLIKADFQYNRFLTKRKLLETESNWLININFNLGEWAEAQNCDYFFDGPSSVILHYDEGIIQVYETRGKLTVKISGDPLWGKEKYKQFNDTFRKAESLVQWVYNTKGDEIQVPLNYRKGINAAYPWFENGYEAFIDSYLASDASILILIGPPGTGKTNFCKNLIHRSKCNAKVAYDEEVLSNDGFFAGFIEDDAKFLVMEDADNFLTKRSNGNNMMHRFLNVSDGLISAADKKLVFSTNLPSVKDIDDALIRPGRCFDVVTFGHLTRDQAAAAVAEAGCGQVPNKDKIILAEIFATQQNASKTKTSRVGFI